METDNPTDPDTERHDREEVLNHPDYHQPYFYDHNAPYQLEDDPYDPDERRKLALEVRTALREIEEMFS